MRVATFACCWSAWFATAAPDLAVAQDDEEEESADEGAGDETSGDEEATDEGDTEAEDTGADEEGSADDAAEAADEEEPVEESESEDPEPEEPFDRATPLSRETQAARTQEGRTVQRWPGLAYPEPSVRGIHGGSLWLTFHGLQWPYAPQVGIRPDTRLGLSGSVWIDTGYQQVDSQNKMLLEETRWFQQGRFVLRGTPTYSDGPWFVQGQAELVGAKDPSAAFRADVDDVWVRAGRWNSFDVQFGRFEAWEIYHYGLGLDQYTLERRGAEITGATPPSIYGATFLFDRPTDAGNVALHLYPADVIRFELLGQLGNSGMNTIGARPAMIVDVGWLKLKLAGEYRRQTWQSDENERESETKGGAAALQLIVDPYVEFGLNGGYGVEDNFDDEGRPVRDRSFTRMSAGAFINGRLARNVLLGAGTNYTKWENINRDPAGRVGEFDHIQAFGAVQYLVMDQLFIKGVFSWANALFAPSFTDQSFENTMLSGRLRLMYLF